MKNSNCLKVTLSALLAASSANAVVLISSDFDGSPTTGPGFTQVINAPASTDPASTANGLTGVITNNLSNSAAVALVSASTVDVTSIAGSTGFEIEWVVSSATNVGNVKGNGWFFGVSAGPNASSQLWNNSSNATGILLDSTNHDDDGKVVLAQDGPGGTFTQSLGVDRSSNSSMEDGFTITLQINDDNSWSSFSTGLSDDFTSSGTLNPNLVYSDMASALGVYTGTQSQDGTTYTVDSVTLTAIIPEPTTYALVGGVIALAIVALRRRK